MWTVTFFLILCLNGCFCTQNEYQIGDLATLYDLIPKDTQKVIENNIEEVKTWQPYGNVDNALLDPQSAALQRKWNEWNAHITEMGNIDSARLLVSFGLLPILSSTGNDLHKYVTLNDKEKVVDILSNPKYSTIDIDSTKSDGSTALILAAIMGYTDIVDILLEEGAYTEAQSSNGATALHFAACLNHTDIVHLLINKYNADCNTAHPFASSTALHFAVEMNNYQIVEILCNSNKCDAEAAKSHQGRSIHIAAETGSAESLIILIEKCKVDLESQLLNDTTAMYLAAQYGLANIVDILIRYGAKMDPVMPTVARRDIMDYKSNNKYGSPNRPNPEYGGLYYPDKNMEIGNGATPLHAATENGHIETVRLLLKAGARQLGTMEGANPLYVAVEYNQYDIARVLLKYDASKSNIDHKIPRNGHSSLYLAVGSGKKKFVKLLLKYGADVNVQTRSGITAIYYACVRRRDVMLKLLLKYVANKNDIRTYAADDGSNPIHAAAQYSCFKCIALLIEYDALLLTTVNNDNQNVLHLLLSRSKHNRQVLSSVESVIKIAVEHTFDVTNIVNQKSKHYGLTPFALSIQNDFSLETVKLLFKYNGNVNVKTNNKLFNATPLFMAVQNNNTVIVQFLLENEADCNVKLFEREHVTPLFAAAEKGYTQIARQLLYDCKDLKLTDEVDENENGLNTNQYTPIHIACMNGNIDIVKLFVEYGITISVMDKRSAVSSADMGMDNIRALSIEEIGPFCMKVYNRKKNAQTNKKEL